MIKVTPPRVLLRAQARSPRHGVAVQGHEERKRKLRKYDVRSTVGRVLAALLLMLAMECPISSFI